MPTLETASAKQEAEFDLFGGEDNIRLTPEDETLFKVVQEEAEVKARAERTKDFRALRAQRNYLFEKKRKRNSSKVTQGAYSSKNGRICKRNRNCRSANSIKSRSKFRTAAIVISSVVISSVVISSVATSSVATKFPL